MRNAHILNLKHTAKMIIQLNLNRIHFRATRILIKYFNI